MKTYSTAQLAEHLNAELLGPGDLSIVGLAQFHAAGPGELTFIGQARFASQWAKSQASAAIVSRDLDLEPCEQRALLVVNDADLSMATALELFAPEPNRPEIGVHPAADIHPNATLGANVAIGPFACVGSGAVIGDGCVLHPHAVVMANAQLGQGCELFSHTSVRDRCILGNRCILHDHAVIGADGFGYRPDPTAAPDPRGPHIVKIPHVGIVRLGDEVEIGANSCVDRAKFGETALDDMVKVDNLVQIGHNCTIGRGTVIAGCAGIAGSVTIGAYCEIGGGVGIADHLSLGDGARIAGGSIVSHHIPAGETWGGFPVRPIGKWRREMVALRRLPDLVKGMRRR